MFESLILNIHQCDKYLEENSHVVLMAAFLISYIIFNYMFKTKKSDQNTQGVKEQLAENYLKRHEKEDRAFFIGEDEDSE